MNLLKILKYITYKRLSDSSSTFFPGEFFFNKEKINLNIIKESLGKDNKGLYIHIPYCITECNYCACFKKKLDKKDDLRKYLIYIIKELHIYYKLNGNKKLLFDTIVFGGGTPSILTKEDIDFIFQQIYNFVDKKNLKEISFECAPYLLTDEKIKSLKENGVSRISIGIQSFDKNVLKINNRVWISYDKIKSIINTIKNEGMICVADLMIGLKGQTLEKALIDYKKINNLNLDSVNINNFYTNKYSKYNFSKNELLVRNNFYKINSNNLKVKNNKNILLQEFNLLNDINYSVIGLGIGSISVFSGKMLTKKENFKEYYINLEKNLIPYSSQLQLDTNLLGLKYLFINLNKKYVNIIEINKLFNINFMDIYKTEINFLIKYKIIYIKNNHIFFLKNKIITQIYFSIFFIKLIDLNYISNIVFQINEGELDLNLISLLDEL